MELRHEMMHVGHEAARAGVAMRDTETHEITSYRLGKKGQRAMVWAIPKEKK